MSLFDYVKSVNKHDGQLELDSEYIPYVINKAFSTYYDTIFYANCMNLNPVLDNQMQYDFYYNIVPKNPKRFAKYPKRETDKYILIVKEYYNCSFQKAKEIVPILNDEQLLYLQNALNKGGKDG